MVHEAADYIKRCMGGGAEDALMFCGSGSSAAIKRLQEVIGIAVPSTMRERIVASLSDEERWVVFVGPYEHHSNLLSWRQTTAEVVEIGMDENGLLDMEALRLHLTSSKYANRPMLGSFSACSNVTGILADTRSLARLLHDHGAFACFDFAARLAMPHRIPFFGILSDVDYINYVHICSHVAAIFLGESPITKKVRLIALTRHQVNFFIQS